MSIKIKYKDPKPTDFGPSDLVINTQEGTIFYKSEKGIFKLQGDNLGTNTDIIDFGKSSLSAAKGLFATPGLGDLKIEGIDPFHRFKVGHTATLEVAGHIIPSGSSAPMYDLGSPNTPFRHLFVSDGSMHFIKTGKGIGFSKIENGFIIERYKTFTDPNPTKDPTILTKINVEDLKAGRSIVSESKTLTTKGEIASIERETNYIRPAIIYHPTDDESAIIHKTPGRLSYRSAGGDPLDIFCDGDSNDTIRLGSTTTNATEIKLHGSISASIDGGSF